MGLFRDYGIIPRRVLRGVPFMISYYRPSKFITAPNPNKTLRDFFDYECLAQAERLTITLAGLDCSDDTRVHVDNDLILSMPVKFVCLGDYAPSSRGLPPIIVNRIGEDNAGFEDGEYCLIGNYSDWLVHISAPFYPWIGDILLSQCKIYEDMALVVYDNGD